MCVSIYADDATGIGLKDDGGNIGIWVENGGQVGVNTSTPSATFEIAHGLSQSAAASGAAFELTGGGTNDYGNSYRLWSRIQTWNSDELVLNPMGNNVGIGITSPTAKLHIDGNIKAVLNNVPDGDSYGMDWHHSTGEIGYDLAEVMWVGEDVSEGDVVVVSKTGRKLIKSDIPFDRNVIGIVSNTSNPRAYPILRSGY